MYLGGINHGVYDETVSGTNASGFNAIPYGNVYTRDDTSSFVAVGRYAMFMTHNNFYSANTGYLDTPSITYVYSPNSDASGQYCGDVASFGWESRLDNQWYWIPIRLIKE